MNHRELLWGLGLSAGIGEDCSWEVRQDWKRQETMLSVLAELFDSHRVELRYVLWVHTGTR